MWRLVQLCSSSNILWHCLGIEMKTDLFQSWGHCWVFQICWHIECSTFTASSFRFWNNLSPPLALFIVMLPKAHMTSHSRMSGSRLEGVKKVRGFPGGSDGKASAYSAGDPGLIPGSGRYPREGNGNPLQYSCLENPMDTGAWWAIVHGVTKSWTWLSDFTWAFFGIAFLWD